jgi:hypothetical protein
MNRPLQHHFVGVILYIWCQTLLTPSAVADTIDVFPLANYIRHVYSYRNVHYTWSFSNYTLTTDSGFVECTLLDSTTVNDTTEEKYHAPSSGDLSTVGYRVLSPRLHVLDSF